jgi:acyl-coenzyme A thioesterase PaaI-like protein
MQRLAETTNFRYPGPGHVLRYARLAIDGSTEGLVEGLLPALDDLCDAGGAIRLGAMALLVDYAAGMVAIQTVKPDWTVTHDLAMHLSGLAPPVGELEASCRLVRAGKSNVLSETSICTPAGDEVARAYVTFTRMPRREGTPQASSQRRVNLAEADEMPRRPLDEAVGFRFSEPSTDRERHHWVEFDHIPFIHNSLGAIQGGVVALALERGASWAGEAELGRPCRTTDLHLHYLALGRAGPFQARAEVLRRQDTSVVSRVALVDTGADDRLLALGVATAEPIDSIDAG